MNYPDLLVLGEKPSFQAGDVARVLGIRLNSAYVLCSRYVRRGLFVRLKKNSYALTERWQSLTREDLFRIANFLQVPSYISFTTALAFFNVTTQVQKDFIESAALQRTRVFEVRGREFRYFKLKKSLYFGFQRKEGIFIADKEKAFLDSFYLFSLGKYPLDLGALDTGALDRAKIRGWMQRYPEKTGKLLQEKCGI